VDLENSALETLEKENARLKKENETLKNKLEAIQSEPASFAQFVPSAGYTGHTPGSATYNRRIPRRLRRGHLQNTPLGCAVSPLSGGIIAAPVFRSPLIGEMSRKAIMLQCNMM